MTNKLQNLLMRQFWSHVFNTPDRTAVFVKNETPERTQVVVVPPVGGFMAVPVSIQAPPYLEVSWQECGYIVAEIMLFLKERGIQKGDRVAILAWNRPEWVWCDLAIQSLGAVSVPIYPNSAGEQVKYILKDSGAKLLLGDSTEQTSKAMGSGIETALFSQAVANAPEFATTRKSRDVRQAALSLVSEIAESAASTAGAIAALRHLGMSEKEIARQPETFFLGVSEYDIATIIYTSGSTGVPKGVVLLHRNIAIACQSLLRHGFDFSPRDRYLSYLPLAHVYERINGTSLCLWVGVPSAYCKVDEMGDVAKVIKPTILLGVPAVWRKVKDKAEAQMAAATGLKARIINWARKQRQPGLQRWIADWLVFSKVRAALGGKVRMMLSGGAPIAVDVLDFFELCGFLLLQGYGLTETTGGIAVNTRDRNKVGSVGRLIDASQVRIVPEPGDTSGSGVIWLAGDTITPGYWQLPEANEKSFKDGWFDTGDLGRLDEEGFLYITGRKKRLLKTDGGKYVAPEKLENAFDGIDELVQYVVPVGDGKPFIGALFFLNQDKARKFLADKGVTAPAGANAAEFYAKHAAILARVAEIVAIANKSLEHWETIKQFCIVPVPATVDNGLLTNKLSIRTEEVLKRFKEMVEELYTRPRPKA